MGFQRNHQDSHEERGLKPKLILVGRLEGSLDGRPLVVIVDGQEVLIELGSLNNALRFRRLGLMSLGWITPILQRLNFRLAIRIRPLGIMELFPMKHRLLRLLLPKI